jgi:hypothetical protein
MEQLIDIPTHIKAIGNILDLVITNIPDRIIKISEAGPLGKSEQSVLLTNVQCGQTAVPLGKSEQSVLLTNVHVDRLQCQFGCHLTGRELTGTRCEENCLATENS